MVERLSDGGLRRVGAKDEQFSWGVRNDWMINTLPIFSFGADYSIESLPVISTSFLSSTGTMLLNRKSGTSKSPLSSW